MTFFDIRVFDPNTKRYSAQSPKILYQCYNKKEKKRQCNMWVSSVKNKSFTPLVFSINAGMGRETLKCYSRISQMLSQKRDESYSLTMSWIRRKLTFSLMRSIITYIRGSRTFKSTEENQCTSEVSSYSETRCVIWE